jgi:ketosteroid isomerase-like protein
VPRLFAPDVHFTFVGDHTLGIDTHDRQAVRGWLIRWRTLFPTMRITPIRIYVAGSPWDVVAPTQFLVSETMADGTMITTQVFRLSASALEMWLMTI